MRSMKRCPPTIAPSDSPASTHQRFSRPSGSSAAPSAEARTMAPTNECVMPRWVSSASTPRLQNTSMSGIIAPTTVASVAWRPHRWRKPACAMTAPVNPWVIGSIHLGAGTRAIATPAPRRNPHAWSFTHAAPAASSTRARVRHAHAPAEPYAAAHSPRRVCAQPSAGALIRVAAARDLADEVVEGADQSLQPRLHVESFEKLLPEHGVREHRRGDLVSDGARRLPFLQRFVEQFAGPAERRQQAAALRPDALGQRADVAGRRRLVEAPRRYHPVESVGRNLTLDARASGAPEPDVVAAAGHRIPLHDLAHTRDGLHRRLPRVRLLVAGLEPYERQPLVAGEA